MDKRRGAPEYDSGVMDGEGSLPKVASTGHSARAGIEHSERAGTEHSERAGTEHSAARRWRMVA